MSEKHNGARVFTLSEFNDSYRVGRTKSFELIASGELETITVGRRRLIPVDSAEAWLASKIAEASTVGV